jgi:hypothetical protein
MVAAVGCVQLERRDAVTHLRGSYNNAFFWRHDDAYRLSAAFHIAHAKAHDVLELTPLAEANKHDVSFDEEMVGRALSPPRIENEMALWGPFTEQFAWTLYRAIDWTHMHHEQTYDILSDRGVRWSEKGQWTERSVKYYLENLDVPRSPAPLDVTMRRAGVMMKPYFAAFRTHYPRSNNYFFVAHWWHPVVYEAMMIAGNGREQDEAVGQVNELLRSTVLKDRPQRMLLSREMMPRYSRLSPASANIFDNLHMLHGIAYDILAYEGWSLEQKRAELYRVIRAMSHQPGDEQLTSKFPIPHPDMDPRRYEPWMKGFEGEMNRIMLEMMEEMMPEMMPGEMSREMHERAMLIVRQKLSPGLAEGEHPGSLMDALKAAMPAMQMDPTAMEPGTTPQKMTSAMLAGYHAKYSKMPPVSAAPGARKPHSPPSH